jgi:voltage-gated potassium channel
VLGLVDFRLLMARHPDRAETIDAEAQRRCAREQIDKTAEKNGEQHA